MSSQQSKSLGSLTKPAPRRWSSLVLKTTVTVAVFILLLSQVDFAESLEATKQAKAGWITLAFAACSIGFLVSTLKWHALLGGLGISCSRWFLLQVYAIGHFTSSFLPGTIGGDVIRLRLAGQGTGDYLRAAASILVERIIGVIAMISMAVVAVAVNRETLATTPVLVLVGSGLGILILGLSVALNRRLATVLMYRTRRWRIHRILSKLYRLHRILRTYPRPQLVVALFWSFLFYTANGLVLYLCCVAFEVEISPIETITVVVIVSVLVLIPISLGGLGLKQAGDVYLLGLLGVDLAQSLAISLLRQLIIFAYTLIGGLVFLFWRGAGPESLALQEPTSFVNGSVAGRGLQPTKKQR